MAGDYAPHIDRFGNVGREDPSRNIGMSYGSLGPWAGAVMQGMGMMPTGPLGVLGLAGSLGLQGLTGKSFGGHVGGLLGFGNGMNPTQRTGLTPEEMMMGRAGGMSGGGGLLDMLGGGFGGFSGGVNGLDRGAMG